MVPKASYCYYYYYYFGCNESHKVVTKWQPWCLARIFKPKQCLMNDDMILIAIIELILITRKNIESYL